MSRDTGTFNFAANFEVLAKAPLDAKQLVGTKADLINPTTWSGSTGVWLYDGAIVSVGSDPTPENNGIYWLSAATNYTNTNSWIKAGTGEGGGTITGGTNGLSTVGSDIILGGGDGLTGDTVINLNNHELQISTTGATQNIIGVDADGILFSISGGSRAVLFDDKTGMRYADDYHADFGVHSLIDKDYADAIVSGLKPKQAVLVATTPAGGVITLSGLTTIDNIVLQNGDRVLVKDQGGVSGNTANGVYVASASTWTRSTDFDGTPFGEVVSGSYMWVLSGDTNANTSWVLSTPDPITIDTTPLQFVYFNHVQNVVGGHGITVEQSGGTHTIIVDGTSLVGNSLTWTGSSGNETFNVDITSGTLNTALNSKLDTSVFDTYTGDTQGILDYAITGATNGLDAVGRDVELGGILTKATTISGDSFNLCLGTTSSSLTQFGVVADDANFSVLCFTPEASTCFDITGGNFDINLNSTGGTITDNRGTPSGLQYDDDYSSNYIPRSIPDAAWVTGYTNSAISNFTNERIVKEITKNSHGFVLNDVIGWSGGTYNKPIADGTYNGEVIGLVTKVIDTNTFDLTQAGYVTGLTGLVINSTYFLSSSVAGQLTATAPTTDGYFNRAVLIANSTTTGWVLPYNGFVVSTGFSETLTGVTNGLHIIDKNVALGGVLTGNTVFDGTGSNYHLQYDADYSTVYTARSIPDAAWVTGKTAAITANNGLTRAGDIISLGGSLTGNTSIGISTHEFSINDGSNTEFSMCPAGDNLYIGVNGAALDLNAGQFQAGAGNNVFDICSGGTCYTSDDGAGICYTADYSSGFVARSLVDAAYVTGLTSSIDANNGLTKAGDVISLGGELTGNTTICGNTSPTYNLCFGTAAAGTKINCVITYACSCVQMWAEQNIEFLPTNIFVAAVGQKQFNINATGEMVIQDNTCNEGLVYAGNYCAASKSNPRWIPDNEYVTGLTSGLATASNGLTAVGQDVKLGGTLSENTSISLGGGTAYNFSVENSGVTTCTILDVNPTTINLCASNVNSPYQTGRVTAGVGGSLICSGFANCFSSICLVNSMVDFCIDGSTSNAHMKISDDRTSPRGIEYAADYSSTYIARSLVDAEYVTGLTSQAILTASNGLTKSGTDVVLGGLLTQATTVNLSGNTFKLQSNVGNCGVADFSLSSTYADSKFGICSNGGSGAIWGLSGNSTSISAQHCSSSSNGSSISITDTGLVLTNKCSGANKTVKLTDNALIYDSCYSTGFTSSCSLVDKGYVDNELCLTSNVMNVVNPPVGTTYYVQRYDDLVPVSGISSNEIYLNYCALCSYPVLGQRVTIVDICGNALTEPIIVNGNGISINGGDCSSINTDYGSVTFVYNGYFWSAIAFVN